MSEEFSRTTRLGEQIHRELAALIHEAVKDPRVGMVTVAGVDVSPDLAHAKVYFSVYGDDNAVEGSTRGLRHAAGFLRRELGRRLRLRKVPELRFIYDDTEARGARLDTLIEQARAEDEGSREQ